MAQVRGIRADGELHEFDQVLMTLPNILVKQIAPDLPEQYLEVLERVHYQWATCLVLALDRPLTKYYWLSIGDPLPFVAAVEHTNFMPPRATTATTSSTSRTTRRRTTRYSRWTPSRCWRTISRASRSSTRSSTAPGCKQKWLFKDPGGQPVITTNYSKSIPDMRTGVDGLYLSNTTQVYPEDRGQNYSLLLGEKVARHHAQGRPRRSEECGTLNEPFCIDLTLTLRISSPADSLADAKRARQFAARYTSSPRPRRNASLFGSRPRKSRTSWSPSILPPRSRIVLR